MNESKSNVPNMYQTIPAVAALNRVPGFEPLKLLRRTKSRKSNEVVLKLALPYKKLWFRLANPKGRIRLNPLTVTEQIAIYEAQVYLDRSDIEPISSFTASSIWKETEKNDYVREAQEEAIDEALSIAGFGLQFADMEMTKEAERFGSEVPLSAIPSQVRPAVNVQQNRPITGTQAKPVQSVGMQTPTQKTAVSSPTAVPEKTVIKAPEPVEDKLPVEAIEENELPVLPVMGNESVALQSEDTLPVSPSVSVPQEDVKQPVETVPQEKQPVATENYAATVSSAQDKLSAAHRAMQILQKNPNTGSSNSAVSAAIVKPEETEVVAPPKYTRDMPVPEILKVMTFEEAQKVVVDVGTCKGKTMQEVAETRPASLKFYLFGGYKEGNNILLAAAKIMYDHLEMKKAG